MASFSKMLLDLTANDLMSQDLTVLSSEMSLRQAAHLLSQAQISGAPVVDAYGRCVGALSTTDFMHCADTRDESPPSKSRDASVYSAWQMMDAEEGACEASVGEVMNTNPVLVAPLTPIGQVAQCMLDAHIHRVFVVNADQRLLGVVSSTDMLAALAWAHVRAHQNAVGS